VKVAVCGLPLALSLMLIVAASTATTEGVNVTPKVQLPLAATDCGKCRLSQ
jgi:hypothetical protein